MEIIKQQAIKRTQYTIQSILRRINRYTFTILNQRNQHLEKKAKASLKNLGSKLKKLSLLKGALVRNAFQMLKAVFKASHRKQVQITGGKKDNLQSIIQKHNKIGQIQKQVIASKMEQAIVHRKRSEQNRIAHSRKAKKIKQEAMQQLRNAMCEQEEKLRLRKQAKEKLIGSLLHHQCSTTILADIQAEEKKRINRISQGIRNKQQRAKNSRQLILNKTMIANHQNWESRKALVNYRLQQRSRVEEHTLSDLRSRVQQDIYNAVVRRGLVLDAKVRALHTQSQIRHEQVKSNRESLRHILLQKSRKTQEKMVKDRQNFKQIEVLNQKLTLYKQKCKQLYWEQLGSDTQSANVLPPLQLFIEQKSQRRPSQTDSKTRVLPEQPQFNGGQIIFGDKIARKRLSRLLGVQDPKVLGREQMIEAQLILNALLTLKNSRI